MLLFDLYCELYQNIYITWIDAYKQKQCRYILRCQIFYFISKSWSGLSDVTLKWYKTSFIYGKKCQTEI